MMMKLKFKRFRWRERNDPKFYPLVGYATIQEAKMNPQFVERDDLPEPASHCLSCATEPAVLIAPPSYKTDGWHSPGLPLLAYVSAPEQQDETIGLALAHCLVPLPHVSKEYAARFRTGGPGFMCFSCLGFSRPLGYNGTLTAVSPRDWITWLLTYGKSARPLGLNKVSIQDKAKGKRSVSLISILVDFYLGSYIKHKARELDDEKMYGQTHAHLAGVIEVGSKKIVNYLYAACLGEARHCHRYLRCSAPFPEDTRELSKKYPHMEHLWTGKGDCDICTWFKKSVFKAPPNEGMSPLDRGTIYHTDPAPYTKERVLEFLGELFHMPIWDAGYGGALWGMAAQVGSSYREGEFATNYTLCDRVFNITHNGGTIFSKNTGSLSLSGMHLMSAILETKARAKHFGEYAWMAGFATPELYKLYANLSYKLLDKKECVLWDAERRSGGKLSD